MTQQQLDRRKERVANETLIISRTEEGFRVYSPAFPGKSYMVSGNPEAPTCTCPDFQYHQSDPEWRCKHILAVLDQLEKPREQSDRSDSYEQEERLAIQNEGSLPENKEVPSSNSEPAQMVLKRSVSPDGRIDSLSVEFSCPVEKATVKEIRSRALKTLRLQSEIVESFLGNYGKQNGTEAGETSSNDGAVPARMLSIAGMNTKWGRRLFINVETNGQTLKLFGNRKQLADAIVAAGFPNLAERIEEGVQLNVPCKVVTQPSENGKYLNIERVLPAKEPPSQGRTRR